MPITIETRPSSWVFDTDIILKCVCSRYYNMPWVFTDILNITLNIQTLLSRTGRNIMSI